MANKIAGNIEQSIQPQNFGQLMNKADGTLSRKERLYLNAVDFGINEVVADCLQDVDVDPNCVDYMGRNALILAISKENLVLIDILLDKLNYSAIEDALLHAISKGKETIVKLILSHESYADNEAQSNRSRDSNSDRSQFSPDITPLILACHENNHEIIQLFIMREQRVEKPHQIDCQCSRCLTGASDDPLNFHLSRLHKYQALSSPAYMALTSTDPVATSFELRQEMTRVANSHKEFKPDYLSLIEQCMNFANDMLDLCRTSKEIQALIADDVTHHPLGTLHKAIKYKEKKFVAHPNCQNHLASMYYGEWVILREMPTWKRNFGFLFMTPLLPFLCIMYTLFPNTKPFRYLSVPVVRFLNHTLWCDSICIALYVAAFTLRIIVDVKVTSVYETYKTDIETLRSNLSERRWVESPEGLSYVLNFHHWLYSQPDGYFLLGCRSWWDATDPLILSECLFAIANVLSFVKLTYIMPAFESLGPLQISLSRMMSDVGRFMTLFGMVFLAFVIGVTNLYSLYNWYLSDYDRSSGKFEVSSMTDSFGDLQGTFMTLFWALFGMSESSVPALKAKTAERADFFKVYENPNAFDIPETVGTILYGLYCGLMNIILLNMLIAMMSDSYDKTQEDSDVEWKFARTKLWLNYIEGMATLPPPFNLIPSRKFITRLFCGCKCKKSNCKTCSCCNRKTRSPQMDVNEGSQNYQISSDFTDLDPENVEALTLEVRNIETSHNKLKKDLLRRYLFKLERGHGQNGSSNDDNGDHSHDENVFDEDDESEIRSFPPSPMIVRTTSDRRDSLNRVVSDIDKINSQRDRDMGVIYEDSAPSSSGRSSPNRPDPPSATLIDRETVNSLLPRPPMTYAYSSAIDDSLRYEDRKDDRRLTKLEPLHPPLNKLSIDSAPLAEMHRILGCRDGDENTDRAILSAVSGTVSDTSDTDEMPPLLPSANHNDNADRQKPLESRPSESNNSFNTSFKSSLPRSPPLGFSRRRSSAFTSGRRVRLPNRPKKSTDIKRFILQHNFETKH
ncbi:short transient receptor potential channel 7-like [Tubulanus polymorphus]|uniref:short transient receptor potential channel 7-like n=1 Tax=Tubulanus polymorphus TaxID=672921 RepID=UPI003DA393D9